MKKAICVGINNYPGTANDLNGCVNDAYDWAGLLETFGFEINKILDEQASKTNILNAFRNLISEAKAGDVVVFTYSGHGTQVLDKNSDEPDGYDEALYVYDGPILDDELRDILKNADKDAQIIVIADSCFSGTITKAFVHETSKPRFYRTDPIPPKAKLKKRLLSKTTDEDTVEVLLTGCSNTEFSYDAEIDGKWNGVLTAFTIPLIEADLTYNELYSKIREKLPSTEFPQTPQLEGSEENKKREIFSEKTDSGDGGDGQGDGPGNGNSGTGGNASHTGCFSMLLSILAIVSIIALLFIKIF